MNWESQFIALFLASLFRPLIVAAAAFLVLRLFRIEHPASQHAVWMAVLLAMVVVPVMSVVIPHVDFAVLPPDEGAARAVEQSARVVNAPGEIEMDPLLLLRPKAQAIEQMPPVNLRSSSPAAAPESGWSRASVLVGVYLLGVVIMLGYHAAGWIMLRRVMARSRRASVSPLRESGDIVVPAAVGLFRPAVLLPRDWREWNPATRRAVLSHEFAHIRRRDPLTSALARFARCLLWFHPLAWWTSRKVSQLAQSRPRACRSADLVFCSHARPHRIACHSESAVE
jgi:beta-lactamase regulating signal transducer with metallopeptidase domain